MLKVVLITAGVLAALTVALTVAVGCLLWFLWDPFDDDDEVLDPFDD